MPDEHVGQLGFDYAWKELLIRSKQTREQCCDITQSLLTFEQGH